VDKIIIQYGICSSPNYEELAGFLNKQIKAGWQPFHPLMLSNYCDKQFFHQVMVKYKAKSSETKKNIQIHADFMPSSKIKKGSPVNIKKTVKKR